MESLKIVVWDISETAQAWMDRYIQWNKVDVVAEVSENEDGIKIENICSIGKWDYLLVFAIGCRELVDNVIRICNIPEEKVIFPLEYCGCYNHLLVMHEILKEGCIDEINARKARSRFLTCTVDGISYLARSSDRVIMDDMLENGRNWAKNEMHRFYELAKQYYQVSDYEGIFCDIGANIGTTCIYFKKNIDPDIKILAFEAAQENYEILRINTMLNHIKEEDTSIVHMGVSDIRQECFLDYCEENPGASSFVNSEGTKQRVQMMPFDDYLSEQGIDEHTIKYIWVDVEGFEGAFLAGARNTLREINVPIMMEFTPSYLIKAGRYEQFMDIITELYQFYIIVQLDDSRPRPIKRLREFPEEDDEGNMVQFDIFLIK